MLLRVLVSVFIFQSFSVFSQPSTSSVALYAQLPAVDKPVISPDGKHVAFLTPVNGLQALSIGNFASIENQIVMTLDSGDRRFEEIQWVNDRKLLIKISFQALLNTDRERFFKWFTVNDDGSDLQEVQLEGAKKNHLDSSFSFIEVLSLLPNQNNKIAIQAYAEGDGDPSVFLYDVETGNSEQLMGSQPGVFQWAINSHGQVSFAQAYRDNAKKIEVMHRDVSGIEDWHVIFDDPDYRATIYNLVAISDDNKSVYTLTDLDRNAVALKRFSLDKRDFTETLFQSNDFDITGIIKHRGEIVGLKNSAGLGQHIYLNSAFAQLQKQLQLKYDDFQVRIVSADQNLNHVVFSLSRSDIPERYFFYDAQTKNTSFWFSSYPHLEGVKHFPKQQFSFSGQDNLQINAFLTLPANANPNLIVLPHGDPAVPDSMKFEPFVQMLARQGYAVLQLNYRGTSGFGYQFEIAGFEQWGKLILQDVYDAIAKAKLNNNLNNSKVCMVGTAYAGFIGLSAAIQKPDLVDCLITINGVSNLEKQIRQTFAYSKWDVQDNDSLAALRAIEPANKLNQVRIPTLIMHAKYDAIVSRFQSENLYSQLKRVNADTDYIEFDNDGHQIGNQSNRIKMYEAISGFLEQVMNN